MQIDLTEFNKLEDYLKKNDYNYDRNDIWAPYPEGEWHQITVKGAKNNYLWDVICHYGSYGYKHGLLEVQGIIVKDEPDMIKWNLTADDVIELLEVNKMEKVK